MTSIYFPKVFTSSMGGKWYFKVMKVMGRLLMALVVWAFCLSLSAQKVISSISRLHDGDLLFQVSSATNAITSVAEGFSSQTIDHVGIFHRHDGVPMVLEANYEGVLDTPFEEFCNQCSKVLVGRVRGKIDISKSLANAHSFLGRSYDFLFLPDNAEIYCSELVQVSFVYIDGTQVFSPVPMSFHDQDGRIIPYWSDFYSRRLMQVPEGVAGSHPGGLSRCRQVRIKYEWRGFAM